MWQPETEMKEAMAAMVEIVKRKQGTSLMTTCASHSPIPHTTKETSNVAMDTSQFLDDLHMKLCNSLALPYSVLPY